MKIKEGVIDGKRIKYVEFKKSEHIIKLFCAKEGEKRKTLEDFCKENSGILAINGGLFNLSSNNAQYIDGIYTSKFKKIGNSKMPVLVCQQDNKMWLDYDYNIENIEWLSWARSASHYVFLNDNEIGYFYNGLLKEENFNKIPSIYKNSNNRTMIGTNGQKIILACSVDKITGDQQGKFMKSLGCTLGINLDGNGSTQMYDGINKKYVISGDGRKITDAFVVWNSHPVPMTGNSGNTSNKEQGGHLKMKLYGSAARLRSQELNGTIKITVPKGQSIDIIGLYGWTASDGYKWAWGKYNGIEGAFQYDPQVMYPVGHTNSTKYKMKLHGSASRLRTQVKGSVIKTVPNYSDINIIEFLDGKKSDGYQWCLGEYNGTKGYFQYDPQVMYPTND